MFKLYMSKQGYNHALAEGLRDRLQHTLVYTAYAPVCSHRTIRGGQSLKWDTQFRNICCRCTNTTAVSQTLYWRFDMQRVASLICADSPDLQGSGRPDTNLIQVPPEEAAVTHPSVHLSAACPPPASVTLAVGELLMTAWLTATTAAGWQTSDADGWPWDSREGRSPTLTAGEVRPSTYKLSDRLWKKKEEMGCKCMTGGKRVWFVNFVKSSFCSTVTMISIQRYIMYFPDYRAHVISRTRNKIKKKKKLEMYMY